MLPNQYIRSTVLESTNYLLESTNYLLESTNYYPNTEYEIISVKICIDGKNLSKGINTICL
jgi:hypothetical protein